jgi:hypothetical protein
MIKTSRAKRKSQTHFEQVPLEVVKKMLGGEAVKTDTAGTNNLIEETALRETEPYSQAARSIAKADIKPKAAGRPREVVHAGHGPRVAAPIVRPTRG